jgi:hypothetical protein
LKLNFFIFYYFFSDFSKTTVNEETPKTKVVEEATQVIEETGTTTPKPVPIRIEETGTTTPKPVPIWTKAMEETGTSTPTHYEILTLQKQGKIKCTIFVFYY